MAYDPEAQEALEKKHSEHPEPGDYWEDHLCPVLLVTWTDGTDVEYLCAQEHRKKVSTTHWAWDHSKPPKRTTVADFTRRLRYKTDNLRHKCWATVHPMAAGHAADVQTAIEARKARPAPAKVAAMMTPDTPTQAAALPALLPCPFCGAHPLVNVIEPHDHALAIDGFKMQRHDGSCVIECGCGAGLIDATQEAVTARWNQRATSALQEAHAELDALRADAERESTESDEAITLAAALEQQRALKIVEAVASLPIGGKDEAKPTPFHAGYQLACEEIAERLRTEVWELEGGITLPQAGTLPSIRQPASNTARKEGAQHD